MVSWETWEPAPSPAGPVEEGGCSCRLFGVEVVPQKASSKASKSAQVEEQPLITLWGFFRDVMPPGCSAAQCDSLPWGETGIHCYSWPRQAVPEMAFQGKSQRDTSVHAPGLARWGVIAGLSDDCETESRTATPRAFCTLALKCYSCLSLASAFPFLHWIRLAAAACLAPCRACGNEPWRGFSGIMGLLWKSPILSSFDRAQCIRAGKLGVHFCSRDLQLLQRELTCFKHYFQDNNGKNICAAVWWKPQALMQLPPLSCCLWVTGECHCNDTVRSFSMSSLLSPSSSLDTDPFHMSRAQPKGIKATASQIVWVQNDFLALHVQCSPALRRKGKFVGFVEKVCLSGSRRPPLILVLLWFCHPLKAGGWSHPWPLWQSTKLWRCDPWINGWILRLASISWKQKKAEFSNTVQHKGRMWQGRGYLTLTSKLILATGPIPNVSLLAITITKERQDYQNRCREIIKSTFWVQDRLSCVQVSEPLLKCS